MAVAKKTTATLTLAATIIWSLGLSFAFPQIALASGLSAVVGAGGPPNGQIGAPVEALVDQQFSESLEPATVTTDTVSLKFAGTGETAAAASGENLCTSVSLNSDRIICNHGTLSTGSWYTFTVTTGVQAVTTGHTLDQNFVSSFKTGDFAGGSQFNPPPFITGSIPAGGNNLPVNGKIVVTFSSSMKVSGSGSVQDADNITLRLVTDGVPAGGNLLTDDKLVLSDDARQLKITPPTLTENAYYQLMIYADNDQDPGNGSCGDTGLSPCVMNIDNLALPGSPFFIDFKAVAADTTAPAVVGSFPDASATAVDRAQSDFSISFNEALDASTVATSTVQLYCNDSDGNMSNGCDGSDWTIGGSDALVDGTSVVLDPDNRMIHLSSNQILPANSKFIIKLVGGENGIADIVGNKSAGDLALRTFTTGTTINGAAADTTEPQVMFASADNFSIAITFSEAMKFNATSSEAQITSNGTNDVNNLSNWMLEMSPDGSNWMSIPTTGKNAVYESYRKTLIISGFAMPPEGSFKATASTNIQDLSGNGMDANAKIAQGTVKSTFDTGGLLGPGEIVGPIDYYNMGTRPINVSPMMAMAGATSRYFVEFPADTAIPASGKITLTFPTGFSFDNTNSDATKRCGTWPTNTFENDDINGAAPGTVAVSSIACNSVSQTATITLGSVAVQAGDTVRFEFQGVVNSTVPKDYSSSGYSVDIKTYNASNVLLESKTSMPFFISSTGSNAVSGTVFNDNGAGGGTANNSVKDGAEAGVSGINICLGGPGIGYECKNTASDGTYAFSNLANGYFHLEIPPINNGTYTGGPFFRDLNISGNVTENFGLKQASANQILDVYIGGTGLDGTKLDIFAFSNAQMINDMGDNTNQGVGGSVVRECTIGTDCDSVQLPLTQGRWQIGVGPWMPKDMGVTNIVPDFNFMQPRSVEVEVTASGVPDLCTTGAGAAKHLCFDLASASNQIKGKVTDGSGNVIQNAFVNARPAFMNESGGPAMSGAGQTDNAGLFTIKAVTGTYIVDASMPGMPPSYGRECTVKADTGNSGTDGNATADVYCEGDLITIANPLVLKIAKGGTSISGRVLDDSSNPISYAHVEAMEVNNSGVPFGGWADAPTDSSGNYTLYVNGGTSTPKKWKLRAFAPGFGELPSLTVAVTEGTNLTGKNLQASSSEFGTVTGTVTRSGVGISGAFVNIHGGNGGNSTVTDINGAYTLKVRAGSGYTIDGFVPGQGPTSVLNNITVSAGQTSSGKNLTIAQAGQITAYICVLDDPSADPSATNNCASRTVSTAFVDARDANGMGNGTSSNPTAGQYDLIVPAGTYTVFSGDPMIGPIGNQQNVVVAAGQTAYVNIAPPVLYQVSGTVTSSNSACIEGVTVFMTDKTNGRVILSRVDSGGNWSQSNVPNGTYSIGAGKPGCVDNSDPGTLTVSGANATAAVRTLVKADATVSGRVILDSANVAFSTMVFATSGTGRVVASEVDASQTGASNNYTLNLTAGTWAIQARSDGSESTAATVTVASGDSKTQNLTLIAIEGYTRKEPRPFNIKPSQGGVVKNPEIASNFMINIPAGVLGTSSNDGSVLTKETTSVVNTGTQTVIGGKGIEITPKDANGQPITTLSSSSGSGVTITIPYDEDDVSSAGGSEGQIVVASWSDEKQQWDPLPTTCDTTNNTCTATTSHFSTFATIVATGGGAPSTPGGLAASAASSSQINLSWTAVSGATSYDIYRSVSSNGTFSRIGNEPTVSSGSTTSYSDTALSASTTYYYKISAINASGESAASSAVSATTQTAGGSSSGGSPSGLSGGSAIVGETTEAAKEAVSEEKPIGEMTQEEIIAKIAQIKSLIEALQAQLAQITGQAVVTDIPSGYKFTVAMAQGETSESVKYLQAFLKAQGSEIYPEGLVTGYYGPMTAAAVTKFQEKYAAEVLVPLELSAGTGFAGAKTIAKINAMLGN